MPWTRPTSALPPIYHFTDVANLEGILDAGALRAHRRARCSVDIADATIKARRARIEVDCGAGGRVCDYVPFYFAPRSPMLFRIKSGGVDGVSSDQRRIIYLVSSTETIVEAGIDFVFTDGNAAAAFTDFYDDLGDLATVVDWPLMAEKIWRNTPEDNDRVRRRCAEFLVHGTVPLDVITKIGVLDRRCASEVEELVDASGWETPVHIRSGWYF
jgi:ssDNA thymidine ADP-ribosyltransferase DarT-like protein